MEFFDQTKSLVENLSFLSGPILVLFSILGIIQIIQGKKALIINCRCDAANLAAQQVRDYGERIIPILTKYDSALALDNVEDMKVEDGTFTQEHLIEKFGPKKVMIESTKRIKHVVLMCDSLNALEGFATYFTKGIADEEIAFSSVGNTFCFSVQEYYIDISHNRKSTDQTFQNIIDLYKLWKPRLEKNRLFKEQEAINTKMRGITTNRLNPIGTK